MNTPIIYDKNGVKLEPFDLIKIFHFTGAHRKKHYMYKWVLLHKPTGYLYGNHLEKGIQFENDGMWRSGFLITNAKTLGDFEIVQGYRLDERPRQSPEDHGVEDYPANDGGLGGGFV